MQGFDWRSLRDASPVYVHKARVRFQDVDAAGFMFFARIFGYFHDAWLAYIEDSGLHYAEVVKTEQWGAPLRHVEADFLAPLRWGDWIDVGLVRAAWEKSNLYIGYRMTSAERVCAVGMAHHVVVGMASMARIDPPEVFRQVFRRLETVSSSGG